MVDRRHEKDALPVRDLEVRDLKDDGKCFHHKNAAHDEEDEFLTRNDRHRTQSTAER